MMQTNAHRVYSHVYNPTPSIEIKQAKLHVSQTKFPINSEGTYSNRLEIYAASTLSIKIANDNWEQLVAIEEKLCSCVAKKQ